MNKVYWHVTMSLDGFIAGPDDAMDWVFGYGFGFVGVILVMMQEIAPGKYQTAHYAFATALMNLGLMIPGTVSGKIQLALGYRRFFIWALSALSITLCGIWIFTKFREMMAVFLAVVDVFPIT